MCRGLLLQICPPATSTPRPIERREPARLGRPGRRRRSKNDTVSETRIGHLTQIVMETMMTATGTTDAGLSWDVLSIRRPGLTRDLPAGKEELMWVANSSTLIRGERDAVLVDTFLTIEQSQTLLSWVVASGKNLTAIYITHGHGDHFFGLAPLLERFPGAKAVATAEVVGAMREQLSPASIESF